MYAHVGSACSGPARNAGPPPEAGPLGSGAARQVAGIGSRAPGGALSAASQGHASTAQTVSGAGSGADPWAAVRSGGCGVWGCVGRRAGLGGGVPTLQAPEPEARPPERTAGYSEPWEAVPEQPVWFLLVRISRGRALPGSKAESKSQA